MTSVLLGDRSLVNYVLINQLLHTGQLDLVIFEQRPLRRNLQLLRRRQKRLGVGRVIQQSLFLAWDRLVIRPASRQPILDLLKGQDTRPPDGRVKTLTASDINSPAVLAALGEVSPRCGVVSGASLLRRPLLDSVPVWLNLHCGITPRYRGVHGAFWAIYEGRPDLAGVTIHQIDTGIDTGGIVKQASITLETTDTYRTLPIKQYLAGIPLMLDAVEQALQGRLTTQRRTDLASQLWYSPTLGEYRVFLRQLHRITA